MATIVPERMAGVVPFPELTVVRRFEAAGFRAWPAASTHYDGAWAVRLTPASDAKRLNSVNPLDPRDTADMQARLARAEQRFAEAGKPLLLRMSPLAPPALSEHLDRLGWTAFGETMVFRLVLREETVADALDQIPLKDVRRFVSAIATVRGQPRTSVQGLGGVLGSIEPETGLFVLEQSRRPVSTAVCVHDGELAGLFEIATAEAERGKGFGRRIVLSALKWARLRGAQMAWLQVEADNAWALKLYERIGFSELYRYHYRRPPEP
jgi:GNAT superfamily N-acetyltransferase